MLLIDGIVEIEVGGRMVYVDEEKEEGKGGVYVEEGGKGDEIMII